MKLKTTFGFLLYLFVLGIVFTSCDKNDFEYEDNFKRSHSAWLDFKAQSNNSYMYTTQGSSWTGYAWETSITVVDGKVVQRSFKYIRGENIPEVDEQWIENEDEINSHKNTSASEACTLDDVYEKAQNDWLKQGKDVTYFFEAKNNGLISLCGYVPDGCMDDCFTGISISDIEVIK